jgi:hypothetical protein
LGGSFIQKDRESKFELIPINVDAIDGDLSRTFDIGLDALLKKDNAMADLFVKGIKNLLLEKNFCNHLMENSNSSINSIIAKDAGGPIYSKPFCIGE